MSTIANDTILGLSRFDEAPAYDFGSVEAAQQEADCYAEAWVSPVVTTGLTGEYRTAYHVIVAHDGLAFVVTNVVKGGE